MIELKSFLIIMILIYIGRRIEECFTTILSELLVKKHSHMEN